MNKRRFTGKVTAMLCAAVLMFLTGCQLAVPDAGKSVAVRDRMAGVFVTTEHLNLFDMEAYLNDNLSDIMNGGGTVDAADSVQYGGRIYADFVEETFTDSAGEEQSRYEYVFTDMDGMLLGSFLIKPENNPIIGEDGYWLSTSDEGLSDVKTYLTTTDSGDEIQQEAYIYVPSDAGEVCFYFNPVYQTADGEVYLTEGQGLMSNTLMGGAMSHTMTDSYTYTEENVEKTASAEFKITIDSVDVPEKVVLIQMNENHREVSRAEYIPGQLPAELKPDDSAAYILVEEHCSGKINRTLNQSGDKAIGVFYCMDNGICVKDYMNVNWMNDGK